MPGDTEKKIGQCGHYGNRLHMYNMNRRRVMAVPQTQQEYWDMGNDTERWWREHIRPHPLLKGIRHTPRAKGHDFIGEFAGHKFYIDTKFTTEPYRQKGWIEIMTYGNVTGIMRTGEAYLDNDNVDVFLVIMAEGEFYLYDVKALINDIMTKDLDIRLQPVVDNMGNKTLAGSVQMEGWDDPRYRLINGPLSIKHWRPQTAFGKGMDMTAWFKGEGI